MQYAVFSSLFIIEHKLHRNARIAGPVRVRGMLAVANQVAGIISAQWVRGHVFSRLSQAKDFSQIDFFFLVVQIQLRFNRKQMLFHFF